VRALFSPTSPFSNKKVNRGADGLGVRNKRDKTENKRDHPVYLHPVYRLSRLF